MFDKFDIKLEEIVTEIHAIENLISKKLIIDPKKYCFIIDLDFTQLKLYVFIDNKLKFFRQISFGFKDIVKDLSRKIKTEKDDLDITEDFAQKILLEHLNAIINSIAIAG